MARYVNPNNDAFQRTLNSKIYVDKTGMLEYTNDILHTNQAFVCNSRPRRFGKSVTADMLVAYYSKGCESKNLFESYKISETKDYEKYLNQYDVIRFDVSTCIKSAKGIEHCVSYIENTIIQELKEEYQSLSFQEDLSLFDVLAQINLKTGNHFVIIIDEWDILIRENNNKTIQKEYIQFLRSLFKGSDASGYIALAYLTGILPMVREQSQSALNNFHEFTMLEPDNLSEYFGFTESEVKNLCAQYDMNFSEAKKWYDGYKVGNYEVYNPNSIVSSMERKVYRSYWSKTAAYESIIPYINMNFDGLKETILLLLSGNKVEIDVSTFDNTLDDFKNKDEVLTYLIHLGYLSYDESCSEVFIPNEEVRQELVKACDDSKWNDFMAFQLDSEKILDATLNLDGKEVAKYLDQIHNIYTSNKYYNNEASLTGVIYLAYLSTLKKYLAPISEMPTGKGYADVVYLPKKQFAHKLPTLIIDLKWDKTVDDAMNQIYERKYVQSLKGYSDSILLVAINYNKTSKEHECRIEQYKEVE